MNKMESKDLDTDLVGNVLPEATCKLPIILLKLVKMSRVLKRLLFDLSMHSRSFWWPFSSISRQTFYRMIIIPIICTVVVRVNVKLFEIERASFLLICIIVRLCVE